MLKTWCLIEFISKCLYFKHGRKTEPESETGKTDNMLVKEKTLLPVFPITIEIKPTKESTLLTKTEISCRRKNLNLNTNVLSFASGNLAWRDVIKNHTSKINLSIVCRSQRGMCRLALYLIKNRCLYHLGFSV